jgi:hypothetical protein
MRPNILFVASLIGFSLVGSAPIQAADTAIGPTLKTCSEVNDDDVATKKLTLVWLYGYASGENRSSPIDFLKGRDGNAFLEHLRAVCEFYPTKGLLTAAREIVTRLRNEANQRQR